MLYFTSSNIEISVSKNSVKYLQGISFSQMRMK